MNCKCEKKNEIQNLESLIYNHKGVPSLTCIKALNCKQFQGDFKAYDVEEF